MFAINPFLATLQLLDKLANIDYVDADTAGLVVSPCFQKEVESKGIVALSANATQKEQELNSMDFATNFMASEEKNVIVYVSEKDWRRRFAVADLPPL